MAVPRILGWLHQKWLICEQKYQTFVFSFEQRKFEKGLNSRFDRNNNTPLTKEEQRQMAIGFILAQNFLVSNLESINPRQAYIIAKARCIVEQTFGINEITEADEQNQDILTDKLHFLVRMFIFKETREIIYQNQISETVWKEINKLRRQLDLDLPVREKV